MAAVKTAPKAEPKQDQELAQFWAALLIRPKSSMHLGVRKDPKDRNVITVSFGDTVRRFSRRISGWGITVDVDVRRGDEADDKFVSVIRNLSAEGAEGRAMRAYWDYLEEVALERYIDGVDKRRQEVMLRMARDAQQDANCAAPLSE
jgi:hypothetical protein